MPGLRAGHFCWAGTFIAGSGETACFHDLHSRFLPPITPRFRAARRKGHAAVAHESIQDQRPCPLREETTQSRAKKGREMPKMKTKSGAKKRFKVTASGRVKVAQAGKRHGMIKRTKKFIRNARGTMVLADQDAKIVKKYMPYL